MENNHLRGLFGVSSPWPVEQRVAPEPTEKVYFEISSGMIEKLLANPFTSDGTLHPDLHLIYVDEVCGLFKLAGLPEDVVKKKVFPLSLKQRHWHGIGYVMILDLGTTTDWNWNFIRSFIICIWFIVIGIIYIIFGLVKEKVSLKLGGGLSQCYVHAPIMSSQEKLLFRIFMLGFLIMIDPCSILLVLVPIWRRILNSNRIYWKELNETLNIWNSM